MKDNNAVNDIFQNDNSSKNKTKTILLLTIVAIILISVFLIIAWVMTRDNPLQDMQKEHEQTSLNQTKERPVPYAHNNMENENPFGIDTSKNLSPQNEDSSLPDAAMSNTPPIGVPTDNTLALSTENKNAEKNNEFERDEKYQAVLKDLEKQHADKKNTEAKKETESQKAKEQAQTKVVMPPVPKETIIAPALDPTKSTQKAKDSDKVAQKPASKEQVKPVETKKPVTPSNTTQKPKDSEKVDAKPQAKQTEQVKQNTPAATQKPESKDQDNKVMQRPQNNIVSANQGKDPEKGHYVQVGAFTDQDKITPEFLNKISKYNYRILKVEQNGVKSAKYLIGPYKTREEVKQIETKIRTEINQGAFYVDCTK